MPVSLGTQWWRCAQTAHCHIDPIASSHGAFMKFLPAGNHTGQGLPALVLDLNRDVVQALFANHLLDPLQAFRRSVPQADLIGAVANHVGGGPAEGLGEGGVDFDKLSAFRSEE